MILGKLKDVDCKSLFSFSNMGIEALPNGKPSWRPLEYEFNEPDDVSLAAATSIRKPELGISGRRDAASSLQSIFQSDSMAEITGRDTVIYPTAY